MPELPEVETIRRGLAVHLAGRTVRDVEVLHPRAVRRHVGGGVDLANRLRGKHVDGVDRRGKYLWLLASDPSDEVAAVVHLGMSGQMLIAEQGSEDPVHLRIRVVLDDGHELRFVDQRTFGGWLLDDLVDVGARKLPESVSHIAADPFEESFTRDAAVTALRRRDTEIKRAILDQTVLSGVGNIYADESLWRAQLHGRRRTRGIPRAKLGDLVDHIADVMGEAIKVGGTSFDDLYVNVNGQSGYFERALNAYGREGLACRRCETPMMREAFMNRSSFYCPTCQRVPRARPSR